MQIQNEQLPWAALMVSLFLGGTEDELVWGSQPPRSRGHLHRMSLWAFYLILGLVIEPPLITGLCWAHV